MQTSLLQYFRRVGPTIESPKRRGSKRTSAGRVKVDALAAAPSSSASADSDSEWCATSSSNESDEEAQIWTRRRRIMPQRHARGHRRLTGECTSFPPPSFSTVVRRRPVAPGAAAPPDVNPFRPSQSPTHLAKGPVHAPVFMRSPSSRRLRRLDRTPVPARRLGRSPRLRPGRVPHLQHPAQDKGIPTLTSSTWADESESELSSVPSSLSELDDTPTHLPRPTAAESCLAKVEQPLSRQMLLKHRRNSLERMCEAQQIPVPVDATKPALVDLLLDQGTSERPRRSERKELGGIDLERLDLVDREIPPDRLEKLEQIGSGAFKVVYVGRYHVSRTQVTPVAISDLRDEVTEMDIKELKFLRDLCHENIVRFIGISIPARPSPVPCMIVSELCENGDLFDYIRNTPPPEPAAFFRLLLQIARGLEYLHTRTPTIVHRDCKSTNVLITRDGTAKIADFGLARVKKSTRAMIRSIVGTVNWQAPELWVPKPNYNEKVDVWSAAMTFWEALQWHQPEKRYPFQGMNEHQIYLLVGQKKLRYVFSPNVPAPL